MRKEITEILENISAGVPVAVIGDIMLDEYIIGDSTRISPEAPEPIIEETERRYIPGGAANVAVNIKTLGGNPGLFGIIGKDAESGLFLSSLSETGVFDIGILSKKDRPTTRKTRLIARGNQVLRVDRETTAPLDSAEEDYFVEKVAEFGSEYVIVSDYAKGMITASLIKKLIKTGKKIILDPKSMDFGIYSGAFLLTPNYLELCKAAGKSRLTREEIVETAKGFIHRFRIANILVTLGADGMALISKDGEPEFIKTKAREVYDVTGAGDTVIAALAASLAAGAELSQACHFAAIAAAIVVGKHKTATASPEEIMDYAFGGVSAGKIVHRETLSKKMAELKKKGKKIVFTNGCFDLLHVGHVNYLNESRSLGDVLIVGLNTDDSVKRLKGQGRPIIPQEQRSAVLASLGCVDFVVLFHEDTPLELIKAVNPDILVKGADYSPETVVGRDYVESYGGKVVLVKFVDDTSTSEIIKKIQNNI